MRILSFSGSPREIGRAFGEACRDEIAEFYRLRVDNAIRQALRYGGQVVDEARVIEAARSCLGATEAYDTAGFDELVGIAEGAGMDVVKILALNGLTDIRDILSWPGQLDAFGGCSAFVAAPDATATGDAICGQTWDLATDNLPFVLGVHRRPDDAPETRCLTTVGCLSLIGLNSAGIGVGTTNVRTTDARPGVTYLSMLHKALSCRAHEDAVAAITGAQRAGAHFFYVVDATGRATVLECSATQVSRQEVDQGVHVQTNHCLIGANQAREGVEPSSSSLRRLARLDELLTATAGGVDHAIARAALADTSGGDDAICRDDIDGINTNGAVVMTPARGTLELCHGTPSTATWVAL